jgi:hypothetical protein
VETRLARFRYRVDDRKAETIEPPGRSHGGKGTAVLETQPLDRPLSLIRAGRKLTMTVFPASLMLATTLGIWAGIAWVLIERVG